MRIVLNQERKEYVIIESVPNEPGTNPPRASKDKFEKHMDDMLDVGCLVLATITLELQKQHEYVEELVKRESVSIAVKLDIGKETARSILKMSRRLKQLEHQFQGLHTRRNLAKGDVDLRVGNGARVATLAVGTYVLPLPSGLILNLENCYFD
ncbi:hypothetical protein V6N12_045941 [Hibiscus sabdariffa]|uniref:Uncharacterized protein n=1 Tax=Hibiscus sabdariffa TaxID=183260 RepID=A0ABR2G4F4_9ROSI